jgi:DNA-binding LacI/PurR family transcriptional regulator
VADNDRTSVTILDVAAAAGVSRQTVSNVINAPRRVTPETAARVRRVIDELGYRPNRAARNLRERASKLLGFRVDTPQGLSNLLDRFLHALTEAARGAGYHVLLFTPSCIDEELATYEDLIRTGTVDGFVLANIRVDDQRPAWFIRRRIPFVCFGRPRGQQSDAFPWVDVDGAAGTGLAVDHLVERGHRRIAYLGWPPGTGWGDDREAGWRAAMGRHGLAIDGLFGACPEDAASASAVAAALLDGPEPPTGFVCGSDTFAVAARLAGGHDPAGRPRVEVVGFDDSPAARLLSPPLSTVRQPLEQVARHVVDLLLPALRDAGEAGAPAPAGGGALLRPDLIVREPPKDPGEGGRPAGGQTNEL